MAVQTPKQARAVQTHADILEAAQVCFAKNGFDSTGVAEICEQADISKGAFYHHFSSKQAVYLELLRDWLADFDQGLEALRQESGNVPHTLRTLSTSFPAIFDVAEGQLPIILDFWVKASREPELWEATIAPFERYYALITGMIEQGIREGSLEQTDSRQTALILISIGVGALLQGLLAEDTGEWGQVGQAGIDLILKSIERK
ncbi:MAG: TetR/AcrR family transcriptional regulator [Anaerolineales bacterium]|jgi:AcrR family transcriptional regulator